MITKGSDIKHTLIKLSNDEAVTNEQLDEVQQLVNVLREQHTQALLTKAKQELSSIADTLGLSVNELAAQLGLVNNNAESLAEHSTTRIRTAYHKSYVDFGTPDRPNLHKLNQRKASFDADEELKAYCIKQQIYNPKVDEWSYKAIKAKLQDKGLLITK